MADRCMRASAAVSQARPPPAAVKATYARDMSTWLKSINRVMRPNVSLLPLYAILHADIPAIYGACGLKALLRMECGPTAPSSRLSPCRCSASYTHTCIHPGPSRPSSSIPRRSSWAARRRSTTPPPRSGSSST